MAALFGSLTALAIVGPDTTAPLIGAISPSGAINNTSPTIVVNYSDADSGVDTASVTVKLDGFALRSCTITDTQASCPASSLGKGSHSISGSVADLAGNVASFSGSFTIDTTAPSVSNVKPTGTIGTFNTTISASYYDAGGINTSSVVVRLDGTDLSGCTNGSSSVSCPVTTTNGPHTISGTVSDRAGNSTSFSGSFFVQVGNGDYAPPTVTGITPTGTISTAAATIVASYYDTGGSGLNTASVALTLDGSALSGCTVTTTSASCPVTGLADGAHAVAITLQDNAGNTGTGSGSFSVDATAPAVTNLLPAGNVNSTSTTLSADFSDAGSGINVASATGFMDGSVRTGCTATATHISCPVTGLSDGAHTISVTVRDNAGNTGSASGSFTVDATNPVIGSLSPSGVISNPSPVVSASYSDAGSGIDAASAAIVLDGTAMSGCTANAASISCPASGLTDGLHSFTVSVSDTFGNTAVATGGFSVDTTAPAITNILPVGTISNTAPNVIAYYNDGTGAGVNAATAVVSLDGTPMSGCTITAASASCPASALADGAHSVSVTVQDNLGNTGAGSAGFTVDSALPADSNAPVISGITPGGPVNTTAPTLNVNYSDVESGVNPAGVVVTLDGAAASGCTITETSASCPASGLAEGAHVIGGTVSDNAGNTAAISGSFLVDMTAPSVSNVQPRGYINTTSTTVSAGFSDAGSGINAASTVVKLDGFKLTSCTVTTSSVSCPLTSLPKGAHTISGWVDDNAGNVALISGNFTIDTTPPSVSSVKPSGSIATFSATVGASYYDASGIDVSSVSISLDGNPLPSCTTTSSSIGCQVAGLAAGTHIISGSVADRAGNVAPISGSFTVTVTDTTAPAITSVTPTGTINVPTATLSAKYSDSGSGINKGSVVVTLDGNPVTGCTVGLTSASCPVTGLADGAHSIGVSVSDNVGNNSTASGSFSVDSTAPSVTIVGPSGYITSTSTTLSASYSDSGSGINTSTVTVNLDGSNISGCTILASTVSCYRSGLAPGAHSFTVSVRDKSNNTGMATGSFFVDAVKPAISALSPSGTTNNASPTISASLTDTDSGIDTASASVYLDSAGYLSCTVTATSISCPSSGLADGVHTFVVRVSDNAGNSAMTTGMFDIDTVPPVITSIQPSGSISSANATVYVYYNDGTGTGINEASLAVYLDGAPLAGCDVYPQSASCNVYDIGLGSHTVTVQVADMAGNIGHGSGTFSQTLGQDITPPAVTLQPSGWVTSSSATVYAYYNDPDGPVDAASVAVYLDGAQLAGCDVYATAAACNVYGLTDGPHTTSASAADMYGNTGTASGSFQVDSQPPVVSNAGPNGLLTTASTSVYADFSDVGSGIDTASASVYLDGSALSGCAVTASSISCPATGLADGTHHFAVNVKDIAGGQGTASGSFTTDTLAPNITAVGPTGMQTNASAAVYAYYDDAGSGVNTASVAVYLDGAALAGCDVYATSASCNVYNIADGTHTVSVTVGDNAGHVATGTSSFTVDTQPPVISAILPSGFTTDASASVYVYYSDVGSGVDTASLAVYLDGSLLPSCTATADSASCATYGMANGDHTIDVSVADNNGHVATGTGTFKLLTTIDTAPPEITQLWPGGPINDASASVYAYYDDVDSGINAASAAMYVDGAALSGCTADTTKIVCPTSGLTDGSHTISARVQDNFANQAESDGSFSVDTALPVISNLQPAGYINTTSAVLSASYSDAGSGINSTSVAVYLDGFKLSGCSVTSSSVTCSVTSLGKGTHSTKVSVTDNAGNVNNMTGSFTVDTTPPSVSNVKPSGTITVANTTVSASYYDAYGINTSSVAVYLNGTKLTTCTVTASSVSCPVTSLANGNYTISGSVADRAGNTSPINGSFIVNHP